jgi:DNA repair protein RadC
MKIKQLPETERPYEKLELYGEKNLSNAELLAIIIKTGTKEETSVELSQRILNLNDTKIDDLSFLKNLTIEELIKLKGIGKVKAIQLKALCELSIRMSKPSNYKKVVIKKPYDLAKILMGDMRLQKREIVKIVILNNKNEIIKIKDIALGGTNIAHLSLKDIISEPLKISAPKIMLVHNHPSGDPTPSKQDITFTNYIYEKALEFDIELIDHLVIGDMNYISIFSEMMSDTK